MADSNNGNGSTSPDRKRSRMQFPRLTLAKALELPTAIYELGGDGEQVRRHTVFGHLKRSADSGPSRMLVINGGLYGLTTGGYQATHLGLTSTGKEIVSTKDRALRLKLAHDALLSNELFSSFLSRFEGKALVNDEIAIDFLKRDHGLPEDDAKVAVAIFKENIRDWGLVKEYTPNRPILLSRDTAIEEFLNDNPDLNTQGEANQKNEHPAPKSDVTSERTDYTTATQQQKVDATLPLRSVNMGLPAVPMSTVTINLQVELPENGTPEIYDSIFASIGRHLLGRSPEQAA